MFIGEARGVCIDAPTRTRVTYGDVRNLVGIRRGTLERLFQCGWAVTSVNGC